MSEAYYNERAVIINQKNAAYKEEVGTSLGKSYFNDAIIGNSRVLGCLTAKGELIRLYWPNIDYMQQIDLFHIGMLLNGNYICWFHENMQNYSQKYIENTNVLLTVYDNNDLGFKIKQTDLVLPGEDILVRNYAIENINDGVNNADIVLYSSVPTNSENLASSFFDFGVDAIVHYRHNNYLAISSDIISSGFQINNANNAIKNGAFDGIDQIGMSPSSAVNWKLGEFQTGEVKNITFYINMDKSVKGVLRGIENIKQIEVEGLIDSTVGYWQKYVKQAKKIETTNKAVNELYNRTILTFALMSDSSSGGLLAAPEIDEEFTRCGRYGYCWGRDATFVTTALDKCGLTFLSDKFYEWCFLTQQNDGAWQQRYYLDGNLAPSWGIQIDETGSILWGIWEHYAETKDINFLERAWMHVQMAADFLVDFIDKETNLPEFSYDLWEMDQGEFTYSASAVYGGLIASQKIANELGKESQDGNEWAEKAASIKIAIEKNLWDEKLGRFIKAVRVRGNPWEESRGPIEITLNNKGSKRHVYEKDETLDVSLLGITVPFGVFPANHDYMIKTGECIESGLSVNNVGGLRRFTNDKYLGGNPWIICSLWIALYYIELKNFAKAKEHFYWAVGHRNFHNFLPEQIDRDNGQPAWVMQLTWSHAMFILVLFKLMENGEL